MRWPILQALLRKEWDRHLANRGGLALLALLIGVALLLTVFNPNRRGDAATSPLVGTTSDLLSVHHCYVETVGRTPAGDALFEHLKANAPPELRPKLVFGHRTGQWANPRYPTGVGALQIRPERDEQGREFLRLIVRHPPEDPGAMAPFEFWFFREAMRGLGEQVRAAGADPGTVPPAGLDDDLAPIRSAFEQIRQPAQEQVPRIQIERQGSGGQPIQWRDTVATALVVFALYFTCCYLLPTLTCEERERGVLLAQALSPASPAEILMGKFLFYPVLGIGMGAILGGIYRPSLLATPFFWASLAAVGGGFLGIGMTIASLARTQRGAFLGAMGYLLGVALVLMVCQQNGIPVLPGLALEYHAPRVLHAAMANRIGPEEGMHLIATVVLALAWLFVASRLFRDRGWQ
jgi:hypothetical protein